MDHLLLSPGWLVANVASLFAILLAAWLIKRSRDLSILGRVAGLTLGLALAALCAVYLWFINPWLHDARFRTYARFFNDIKSGMTEAEVLNLLEQHYPTADTIERPRIAWRDGASLGFFMDSHSCEGVFLNLEHGRVTKRRYSTD